MMRKLLAAFAILAIVYFFWQMRQSSPTPVSISESDSVSKSENSNEPKEAEPAQVAMPAESISPAKAVVVSGNLVDGAAREFPEVLRSLGTCFDIRNQISADQIEPSMAQLTDSLRGELGDAIADYEDWSNEHVTLPNGEQRRLRLENSADANGVPGRFLRYFKLDREGLPEPIALPLDQTRNPSDETLNALRGEGQRSLYERSVRSYFQNGEELMTVERNGYLTEIDMAKGNKTFKCTNLNSAEPSCRCSDY